MLGIARKDSFSNRMRIFQCTPLLFLRLCEPSEEQDIAPDSVAIVRFVHHQVPAVILSFTSQLFFCDVASTLRQ